MPVRYTRHSHKLARQEEENVQSFAEAYPPIISLGNDEENFIPTKVEEEPPLFFVPIEQLPEEVPAQLPEEPVPTTPEAPNEKKNEEVPVVEEPIPTKRTQKSKPKPTKASSSGVFFPVNFGTAEGGSIAISNSYSTARKGSSKSNATSYGTPVLAAY